MRNAELDNGQHTLAHSALAREIWADPLARTNGLEQSMHHLATQAHRGLI